MSNKLNITPGPWISKGISIYSVSVCSWHILTVNPFAPERENSEANTTAIVSAVNNTYHKGINPEAVPEMLEVAKEVREWYEKNHAELLDQRTPVCFSKLLSVIQKATL